MRTACRGTGQHQRLEAGRIIDAQPLTDGSAHRDPIGMCARNLEMVQNGNGIAREYPGGVRRRFRLVTLPRAALVVNDHLVMPDKIPSDGIPDMMVAVPSRDKQEGFPRSKYFIIKTCAVRGRCKWHFEQSI